MKTYYQDRLPFLVVILACVLEVGESGAALAVEEDVAVADVVVHPSVLVDEPEH